MHTHPSENLAPYFDRLSYFYGQMLGERDFRAEQAYYREKLKLHNRCLHGPGVVCGLAVHQPRWIRQPAKTSRADDACWPQLHVQPGLALDADGNELVVRDDLCVDLGTCLSHEDRKVFAAAPDKPHTVYLNLCFREQPIEPIRPVLPGDCGPGDIRHYAKIRDSVCVQLTRTPPVDERCSTCCEAYPDAPQEHHCSLPDGPPVLLARIDFTLDKQQCQIHNAVRPLVGRRATTITSINWVHGGVYERDDAHQLLERGLRIHCSRAIRPETIKEGIVDVLRYEGGGHIRGDIKYLAAKVEPAFVHNGEAHGLVIHAGCEEHHNTGDRIHIVLRSAFVLDRCCRPLDGVHVGGCVSFYRGKKDPVNHPMPAPPPQGCEPWHGPDGRNQSGIGVPGGNFESWFFVKDSKPHKGKY